MAIQLSELVISFKKPQIQVIINSLGLIFSSRFNFNKTLRRAKQNTTVAEELLLRMKRP